MIGRWWPEAYEVAVLADRELEGTLSRGWGLLGRVLVAPVAALIGGRFVAEPAHLWVGLAVGVYVWAAALACEAVERGRLMRELSLGVHAGAMVVARVRAVIPVAVVGVAGVGAVVQLGGGAGAAVGWLALTLLATAWSGVGLGVMAALGTGTTRRALVAVGGVAALMALSPGADWAVGWVPMATAYGALEAFGAPLRDVFVGAGRLVMLGMHGVVMMILAGWVLARRRW
ncbi:hypothetical protein DL240_07320 [Lujinxingia litoralis]|uniref:ABC-2 type transporter transmembrane domain-containing protein n=1 Tax=Lujinxingia litoralis TaxID=2211119 RepID=A0A328C8Y6_9DELT|nr:hypothetical protein [Lujinxingia litoralis]RAL23950.1 hypothetical protein DL240_07320 [Lujinxingia litoralis]